MLRINEAAVDLESFVDAFECAHAAGLGPSVEDFLPDVSHPHYAEIVGELLRIDLELSWQCGTPSSLARYRDRFADVLLDPHRFEGLAFEEYRMRCHAGDATTPIEYRDRYGIDVADWPPPKKTNNMSNTRLNGHRDRSDASSRTPNHIGATAIVPNAFSDAHQEFPNFTLVEELGRGGFGRVYLARQRDLANRLVAIKLSPGASVEPDRLAQLQHANIVPIYSVHQAEGMQAICMPYLGRLTLADVLGRLRRQAATPQTGMDLLSTVVACDDATIPENFIRSPKVSATTKPFSEPQGEIVPSIRDQFHRSSYVDAVVWVTAQIAAGLAHAHERGILHRDLKPANILLADDGRPMILDFNLSDRIRSPAEHAPTVGGTLPYMSPEQLAALETGIGVDARSDVFSLGVVLFELLTRRLPFEPRADATQQNTALLIAQRQLGAPSARNYNLRISPSINAVVARCLAPQPADRYQTADELRTDLERHLGNQPLKHAPDGSFPERLNKWVRRHPRMSSTTSLGIVAAAALACISVAWIVRERGFAHVEAQANYDRFVKDMPTVLAPLSIPGVDPDALDEGIQAAQSQLQRFNVSSGADWQGQPPYALLRPNEQPELDNQLTKTLYLLASAFKRRAAIADDDDARLSALQQAINYNAQAIALLEQHSPGLRGVAHRQRDDLAAALRRTSAPDSPDQDLQSSTSDAEMQAIAFIAEGRYSDAIPKLIQWRDRSPDDISAWLLLGNAYAGIGNSAEAEACYTFCTVQRRNYSFSYFLRGLARCDLHKFQGAVDDFSTVLKLGGCPTAAIVNRALAYHGLGDEVSALADLDAALRRPAASTRLHFVRAEVRRSLGDQMGAMQDFQQGLRETPQDATSWLARGMARLSFDPEGALADFQRALELEPGLRAARRNIVHVLADRLDREPEAIAHLDALLAANPQDSRALASRAVSRARLGDAQGAIADAEAALKFANDPKLLVQVACAYALCSHERSELSSTALTLLAKAVGADPALAEIVKTDPDLEPIRNTESFRRILDAAQVLMHDGDGAATAKPLEK